MLCFGNRLSLSAVVESSTQRPGGSGLDIFGNGWTDAEQVFKILDPFTEAVEGLQ